MVMVPTLWAAYVGPTPPLAWVTLPFKDSSRPSVPDAPGVYAFLVVPNIAGNLNVSYLMYIGKTDRPLRRRFVEYLREAQSNKIRPKLLRVLPLYSDHLVFACATTPTGTSPKDVEAALLTAFSPPGNDQIPGTVGRARKAFQ
jgi:hypothetical protein